MAASRPVRRRLLPKASLHTTAPDPDIQAAAAHLSNTLLNYSHHDWEQAQREDPLCDATLRHIQLGCPKHSLDSLCNHLPSHPRPDPADILDLAAKGRLIQGNHDTVLLVRKPTAAISTPDGRSSPSPCPTALASPSASITSGLCLLRLEETHTSSYLRTTLAALPTCSLLPRPNLPPKAPQTFW